jgi:hypothetical protein
MAVHCDQIERPPPHPPNTHHHYHTQAFMLLHAHQLDVTMK